MNKETKIAKDEKIGIILIVMSLVLCGFLIYFLEYKPERSFMDGDCYYELKRLKLSNECLDYNGTYIGVYWERGKTETLVCQVGYEQYEEINLLFNSSKIEEEAKEECMEYKSKNSFKYRR